MALYLSPAERDVRAFAAEFGHLPSVRQGLAYCESGRISWEAMADLCAKSLAAGLASVR